MVFFTKIMGSGQLWDRYFHTSKKTHRFVDMIDGSKQQQLLELNFFDKTFYVRRSTNCKVKLAVASRASYPYHGFPLDPLGGLQGLLDLSWIRRCRNSLDLKLNLFSLTFWIIWCYWCENGWTCPWYKNHVLRCWDDGRYWTSLQLSISTKW